MLTQIDVDSENAFLVPILGVTPKDSLLIRKITGLNPPDINLFIGDYAQDGGTYQGRRVGNRNVVIIFDLNPNPALGETVSGLRDLLYKAFIDPQPDADHIKLTFHDDEGRQRYVVGYVEKFETDIFDVDNMCQISIICPDPYIRDVASSSISDPSGWIVLPPFDYGGTAETGFEVEVYVTAAATALTLELNYRTMVIEDTFTTDQVVYINTVRGSKSIMVALAADLTAWYAANPLSDPATAWAALADLGQANSLISKLALESRWLELHSQSNVMKVYAETSADVAYAIRKFVYRAAYWGV